MDNQTESLSESTQHKRQWSWGALEAVVIGIIGSYAFSGLVVVAASMLIPDFMDIVQDPSNTVQFLLNMVIVSAGILPILLFLLSTRTSVKELGFLRKPRWKDMSTALVAYVPYIVILLGAFQLLSHFLPEQILNQQQDIGFTQTASLPDLLLVFVALVIITPLFEEMIYRGFVFKGLMRSFGFIPALLVSSLIFALVHGQLNVMVDTFLLGLALGYVYHRTGQLWASISLHMIKNAIAFSLLFL